MYTAIDPTITIEINKTIEKQLIFILQTIL